jgi:segregation and condensation protein B
VEYAGVRRVVTLEELTGGYQIRTKIDNMNFLKGTVKARPFKLSGPALETLAIVAYKQPVVKVEIDQIRGVESGHLMRALMEKGLVNFEGKAEHLPGKPMQYGTTRKFLEIFGLRNLKELPTLSQIDELLPEGIGEEVEEKPTLSMVTDSMSEEVKTVSYSQGEEELGDIEDQLTAISTSSEFFEQEKLRQKMKRDEEKAQNIRESILVGEEVAKRDLNWLKKYEEGLLAVNAAANGEAVAVESASAEESAEAEAETEIATEETDVEFMAEEAAHIEDEIPFLEEADEDSSEEGHA